MGTANDIIGALEADVVQIILPTVQKIRDAFAIVQANPGNAIIFAEQQNVIVGSINALILDAPALLPVLQAQGIATGAGLAVTELDKILAQLEALLPQKPAAK